MKHTDIIAHENGLSSLYKNYKTLATPLAVTVICFFIFIDFIVPQIQQWLDLNNQVHDQAEKLHVLKQNFNVVSLNDENALTMKLQTVTAAAPASKDYLGILSSISHSALESGVILSDYSFLLGDLNNVGTKNTTQVTLTLGTSIDRLQIFLIHLKKQLPLSTVTSVSMETNNFATVVIQFYARPFAKAAVHYDVPISDLSPSDEKTISDFSTYEVPSITTDTNTTTASSSGEQ